MIYILHMLSRLLVPHHESYLEILAKVLWRVS